MTTAEHRKRALEAEARLEWDTACVLWMHAVDSYPAQAGALAQADKSAMYQRACECKRYADREAQRACRERGA